MTRFQPELTIVFLLFLNLASTESFASSYYNLNISPRASLRSDSPFPVRDVDVSDDQLLNTELEFEDLVKRVAPTAISVQKSIKLLETEIAGYKKSSESLQRYIKTEDKKSAFHPALREALGAKFERDLANKKRIFEDHVRNERVIDKDIEALEKARITKDAKKLKKALQEYRRAFSIYWAQVETFMKERNKEATPQGGSETGGSGSSSKAGSSGKQGRSSSGRGSSGGRT
ncbi:hypothetical protein MMC10_001273 [Thelotrema lepadinum]|nr:hypothetical protein [Thelotrema lepadinum]